MSYVSYGKRDWLRWLHQLGGGRLVREESVRDHRFIQYEMLMEYFPDWDAVIEAFDKMYPKTGSASQASQTTPPQKTVPKPKSTPQAKKTVASVATQPKPIGASAPVQTKKAETGASKPETKMADGANTKATAGVKRSKKGYFGVTVVTKEECIAFLRELYAELGKIPTTAELDRYATLWGRPHSLTMSRRLGPKDCWGIYLVDGQANQKAQNEPGSQSDPKVQSGSKVQSELKAQSEPKAQISQVDRKDQKAQVNQTGQADEKARLSQGTQKVQLTSEEIGALEPMLLANLPNLGNEARECVIFLRKVYVELGEVPTLPDIDRYAKLWNGPSYGTIRGHLGGRNDWQKYLAAVDLAGVRELRAAIRSEEQARTRSEGAEAGAMKPEASGVGTDATEPEGSVGLTSSQGDKQGSALPSKRKCLDFLKRLCTELQRMPTKADVDHYSALWGCPGYYAMNTHLGGLKKWHEYLGELGIEFPDEAFGSKWPNERCANFLRKVYAETGALPTLADIKHYAKLWGGPTYSTILNRLGGQKEWQKYLDTKPEAQTSDEPVSQVSAEVEAARPEPAEPPPHAEDEVIEPEVAELEEAEPESGTTDEVAQADGLEEVEEIEEFDQPTEGRKLEKPEELEESEELREVDEEIKDPDELEDPELGWHGRQPRMMQTRTQQDCIDFLRELVVELGRIPSSTEVIHYAPLWWGPSLDVMRKRLGPKETWAQYLEKDKGLPTKQLDPELRVRCLEFLGKLCRKLKRMPTVGVINYYADLRGEPRYSTMVECLGCTREWGKYLDELGIELPEEELNRRPQDVPERSKKDECVEFLHKVYAEVGRIPTVVDVGYYANLWGGPTYSTLINHVGGKKQWGQYLNQPETQEQPEIQE